MDISGESYSFTWAWPSHIKGWYKVQEYARTILFIDHHVLFLKSTCNIIFMYDLNYSALLYGCGNSQQMVWVDCTLAFQSDNSTVFCPVL